jgi:hypothetical protein
MKRAPKILLVLLVPLGIALGVDVIRDLPTAYSNGTDIIVDWRTVQESGVARFEILRRVGTEGEFLPVGLVNARRADNSTYEFIDRQVFKSSGGIYQYQVQVILESGQRLPPTPAVTVSHLSSAARRTWGSIKAMFR